MVRNDRKLRQGARALANAAGAIQNDRERTYGRRGKGTQFKSSTKGKRAENLWPQTCRERTRLEETCDGLMGGVRNGT